jgi:hypothetical protein
MKFTMWLPVVLLIGCVEQRAAEQFTTTVNRLCITAPTQQSIDQYLYTHAQGCVFVSVEKNIVAGLDETGMTPGVYRAQATNLGFSQYRDEVIIARAADTLVVMSPAAFHVLAEAAGKVHEARLEEEQARAGLGFVVLGLLQTFTAAEPQQLTDDQIVLLRKSL